MRIKDQERLMQAVKEYLIAKDAYTAHATPGAAVVYQLADKKLRDTYIGVYAATHT